MTKLRTLLNSKWFFPSIVLYYGVFYILFGECYPKKVSTDGAVFLTLLKDFTASPYFDTYYVNRIAPPLLVRSILKLFSLDLTVNTVFIAFQILNLICIATTCYFLKKLFILFKISLKKQLLGFTLFLLNFAIIKYPFYLPVMTDTSAIMLSTLLLYFYLKNKVWWIIIITAILAFTWPMGYYQGLLLIAFPINIMSYVKPSKFKTNLIHATSVLFAIILIVFLIYIKQAEVNVPYVARLDREMLPISITGVIITYYFFAKIFLNNWLTDVKLFLKKLNPKRIILSLTLFSLILVIVHLLKPHPTPTYTTTQMLSDPIVHALIKPFVFIVADTTYFGIIICLLLFFWKSFSKVISQLGWGIVAAFALNLFLFGVTPQSRHLSNLFPWIIVFLIKALDKYAFSNTFYFTIAALSLFTSKIWLILNNFKAYPPMKLDRNGSMGFPQQKFWMHIGPWMNEHMYFVQGTILLLFILFLFCLIYKLRIPPQGRWSVINRFSNSTA